MIPPFNQSGVLPPFMPGFLPTQSVGMAPYKSTLLEFAQRFSAGTERLKIIRGLIMYRAELRSEGISSGFQWIDGSFVEDIEKNQGRPPNDVDVVTFAHRPVVYRDEQMWRQFVSRRSGLFDPPTCKSKFVCDAYYVDMNLSAETLVSQTRYWFGLFSHRRDTYLWKGMLEIPLGDDKDVTAFLNGGDKNAS